MLPNGYRFPDVSKYRTVCDWQKYSTYPISSCKASEGGSYNDPSFAMWLKNMRSRGLFPVPYHFLRAEYSIQDQVENYLNLLDGLPFGVMLDVETSGVGSNPTIAQANAWFNEVSRRTKIPRSNMLLYMPRWWYLAHGGGSVALRDTILWNSHYTTNPNMNGFAGDTIEVLQYSSSAPIAGLCPPMTGDMNIAVNMTPTQFLNKITNTPPPEEDDMLYIITYAAPNKPPRCYVDGALVGFPNVEEMTEYVKAFTDAGYERRTVTFAEADDWQRHMDGHFGQLNAVNVKLTEIEKKVDEITTSPVDVDALATSLVPKLIPEVQKVVDTELDKRTLAD